MKDFDQLGILFWNSLLNINEIIFVLLLLKIEKIKTFFIAFFILDKTFFKTFSIFIGKAVLGSIHGLNDLIKTAWMSNLLYDRSFYFSSVGEYATLRKQNNF